ncbi:MAG: hypothetical protein V3T47_03380 [Gammaproteobacteria bacterium]
MSGWLRLCLVLSVLWSVTMAGIAWLLYAETRWSDAEILQALEAGHPYELGILMDRTRNGQAYSSPNVPEEFRLEASPDEPEYTIALARESLRRDLSFPDDPEWQSVVDVVGSVQSDRWSRFGWPAVLVVWILPIGTVFLLRLGYSWVIGGFSKTN